MFPIYLIASPGVGIPVDPHILKRNVCSRNVFCLQECFLKSTETFNKAGSLEARLPRRFPQVSSLRTSLNFILISS